MFTDTELEVDRQMFDLNVLSILSLTKLVLPHMLERKQGHIVVMSSIAGKMGKFVLNNLNIKRSDQKSEAVQSIVSLTGTSLRS